MSAVVAWSLGGIDNATHVVGTYVVVLGGIGLFVLRMRASARRSAERVPPEDRPWT
ncbi:MAG: hypothetical protein ACKOYG_11435 [Ilumatobacteraceae bacterium]